MLMKLVRFWSITLENYFDFYNKNPTIPKILEDRWKIKKQILYSSDSIKARNLPKVPKRFVEKIPKNWASELSKNQKGIKYVNPKNSGDYIRFMNKNSSHNATIRQKVS